MSINCIIVEDEPLAQERTRDFVLSIPYLHLVASFDNGMDALMFFKSNKVDLVFLDINMDGLSGVQFLETAKPDCEIIITTAYQEYALKGYELNVTDYLLKPYTFERFLAAVEKAEKRLVGLKQLNNKKIIFVKTEYRLEKIELNDLLYIEGMRDYRRIHTIDKSIMTLQTFKDFEIEVSPTILCRVHKSFMVAIDKIEAIERDKIKLRHIFIPISDTYKKGLFEILNTK